jgi:plastocyanin
MPAWTRIATVAGAALLLASAAGAAEPTTVELTLKDHRFTPAEVKVPAGQPFQITVHNQDGTAEELDSGPLKVEKVVPPGGSATVRVRPLQPGRYKFVGEYNEKTAQGVVVAE